MTTQPTQFNWQFATVPVTALMMVVMVFGGWYVKDQGSKTANTVKRIDTLADKVATLELETSGRIAAIQVAQAVNGQKLEQLNTSIQRLLNREDVR